MNRSEVREPAELYLTRVDERLERRFAVLEANWERRFAEQDARLERRLVEIEATAQVEMANRRLESQRRDLLRWLFIFWAGTIVPLAGLMIALVKL